ncbi:MAG: phage head-tail connector protein [Candidatus Caldarchaeum sp.]
MPYTTLARVKEILQITVTDKDTMLNNLIAEVDEEINSILSRYTTVPVADPNVTDALNGVEAEWVAGLYRMYTEPAVMTSPEGQAREHVLTTNARRRLYWLIEKMFKQRVEPL